MPLMKYFVFVGSALVLLLLAMNWLLPDPTAEPVYSSTERPVIRISSIETLPGRVVFDTSRPYMAPPPSVMRVAAQPLQSALAFEQNARCIANIFDFSSGHSEEDDHRKT